MKTSIYTIYDTVAKIYNKPFYLPNADGNHALALRTASDLANDPSSECFKNPTDYSMWYIGEFDDQDATIDTISPAELVCRFHELQ